jgi:diguanylate cyclase (GGDEF)-like protein
MDDGLSATLSEFVGSMAIGMPVEGILDRFTTRLVETMPVTGAGVTLLGSELKAGYVTASSPAAMAVERLQTELGEGPCVAALDAGEVCSMPDLRTDRRFARYSPAAMHAGLGAVFAFPLRAQGTTLGAVDLYRETSGPLSDDDLDGARMLTDVVATLVLNAQQRRDREAFSDHLQNSVHRDPLTGLPNRQLLQERLEQAARRRARSGQVFGLIFLDLDNFKTVNDQYGHGTGDELLTAFARRLSTVLRPADTLARFGGDEFVILCEELQDGDIEKVVTRITAQFAEPYDLARTTVAIQASVGVALCGDDCASPGDLLRAADEAMYVQKHAPDRDHAYGRRRSGSVHPIDTEDADDVVGRFAARDRRLGRWRERWIGGATPGGGAFALIASNTDTGELLITEYDHQAHVVRRHDWQPAQPGDGGTDAVLVITDWEEREISRRQVEALPAPPDDAVTLARLIPARIL